MQGHRSLRIHQAVIVLLLLVIAALAYKFVVAGSTGTAHDGRTAVLVSPAERDLVLREMRGFIDGTRAIVAALGRNDMKAAAAASRAMGSAHAHGTPMALFAKLPLEFKSLALGVHRGFDALALDAETMALPQHALGQLAEILQRCAACHATYALKATP